MNVFGRRLVENTAVATQAYVLDIGSGRGASLFPASQAVHAGGLALGTDLAYQMAQETWHDCLRNEFNNVRVLQMDGDYLAFASATFDFILSGFAVFLFTNPKHTFLEWHRVLKLGGKLGICVATGGDERWGWYEELLVAYHKRHHFPLSANSSGGVKKPDAIQELLQKTGFRHVEIVEETYEFDYVDAEQWWQTKWTHGARFPLENMSAEVLVQFKAEVFERLRQSDDFHEKWRVAYVIGVK